MVLQVGVRTKGKLDYGNGKLYVRELLNGKPEGTGVFNSPKGRHVGEFQNGRHHGKGIITYCRAAGSVTSIDTWRCLSMTRKITCMMLVISLLVACLIPTSAHGPERETYTNENPAPYAIFNSITDNVAVGDERNFVRIREAGSTDTYTDEIEIVPGSEYEVYIYYHNNAASNTNETGYGMATNVRVASAYPVIVKPGERGMVSGIISWSYVTPEDGDTPQTGTVWDEAYFTTQADEVELRYKAGTAIIHNGGKANGFVLLSDLFTEEGTPIGYNELAGKLPGCAEYSGYITYTLIAENART